MVAVSTTLMQTFVNSFGTDVVAANTAVSRVEQLAHMPYGSLSAALATYAGQNYGAGRMDRVKDGFKHTPEHDKPAVAGKFRHILTRI